MCRSLAAGVAVLLLAMSAVHEAWADPLGDARKAIDGSDYPAARAFLATALESGSLGPAELAETYKLTGIVEGALGNDKGATDAFAKWLSIEDRGTLPVGTSPKITRPFTAAQERAAKRGVLAVKSEISEEPPTVTLVIVSDPEQLIVSARATFTVDRGPEQSLTADGSGRITLELGTGKRIDVRLHGLDKLGNRVVELGSKEVPIVITSSGKTTPLIDPKDRDLLVIKRPEPHAEPRPWYWQWWVWGIATGVTAGVGGYFAWRTHDAISDLDYLNANSLAYRWSQAQEVESRARRDLLVTNITVGVAGAFAIGTAILYFTRPSNEAEPTPRASIAPMPGGGSLVVGGRF